MKPRHLWLGFALASAGALALWGPRDDEEAGMADRPLPVHATVSTQRLAPGTSMAPGDASPAGLAPPPVDSEVLVLVPRQQLMEPFEQEESAALFAARSWAPAPPPRSTASETPAVASTPALPFTYLGKEQAGQTWRVFLATADATLVVGEADSIGNDYKVISITPPTMTLEYLPLHTRQTLQIE